MNIEYVLDDKIQCKSTKMDLVLIFGANCIVFYIFAVDKHLCPH